MRLVGRAALCAYCRRHPINPDWRPFCSERCKLMDLGQWLEGGYRVPGAPVAEPAEPDDSSD